MFTIDFLDSCPIRSNPPKDIRVIIRKGDHTGINSHVTNVSLQQFRQMIGLQCSSTIAPMNDRRISSSARPYENRHPYSSVNNNPTQPLSSSSSSSSSSVPTSNARLVNGLKQRSQEALLQPNFPSFQNNDRQQHSLMLPISPRKLSNLKLSITKFSIKMTHYQ